MTDGYQEKRVRGDLLAINLLPDMLKRSQLDSKGFARH